ncbi:MAG: hypothetical protein RSB42_10900, partial [Comamonas sp.]
MADNMKLRVISRTAQSQARWAARPGRRTNAHPAANSAARVMRFITVWGARLCEHGPLFAKEASHEIRR